METSGQLYLSPAPVTIPACLPHCPEGNSSLSWCRRGWQGEPGLSSLRAGQGTRPAAVAAATVLLGRVALPGAQQWGLLPTLPRDTLREATGGSSSLQRVREAGLSGFSWGCAVGSKCWGVGRSHGLCPGAMVGKGAVGRDTGSMSPVAGRGL